MFSLVIISLIASLFIALFGSMKINNDGLQKKEDSAFSTIKFLNEEYGRR